MSADPMIESSSMAIGAIASMTAESSGVETEWWQLEDIWGRVHCDLSSRSCRRSRRVGCFVFFGETDHSNKGRRTCVMITAEGCARQVWM